MTCSCNDFGIPQAWGDTYEAWRSGKLISGPYCINYTWMQSVYQNPSFYGYDDSIRHKGIKVETGGHSVDHSTMEDRYWPKITYGIGNLPESLSASILASSIKGIAPLSTIVQDISSGSPTSWNWTYPGAIDSNGNSSCNNQHPGRLTYKNTGNFNISLSISNGGSTSTASVLITVGDSSTAIIQTKDSKYTYTFYDNLHDDNVSRTWNFGDGIEVINENPVTHTYTKNGTYKVTLIIL